MKQRNVEQAENKQSQKLSFRLNSTEQLTPECSQLTFIGIQKLKTRIPSYGLSSNPKCLPFKSRHNKHMSDTQRRGRQHGAAAPIKPMVGRAQQGCHIEWGEEGNQGPQILRSGWGTGQVMEGLGRVFCLACFCLVFASFTVAPDCFAVICSIRCFGWRRGTPPHTHTLKRTLVSFDPLPGNEPLKSVGSCPCPQGASALASENRTCSWLYNKTEGSLRRWILEFSVIWATSLSPIKIFK